MKKKWWILAAAVLILGIAAWYLLQPVPQEEPHASNGPIGYAAPDFKYTDMKGNTAQFSSLAGRAVILNFWATWCPSCKEELPAIQALYREIRKKNLPVEFLGVDVGEDAATVQDFMKKNGYDFPVILDAQQQVAGAYMVQGIPTTFFIDKSGIIRSYYVGPLTESQFKKEMEDLLKYK